MYITNQLAISQIKCAFSLRLYRCALELATGKRTFTWITFCMNFIDLLCAHDIKPIMVFDGCPLPSKKITNTSRGEVSLTLSLFCFTSFCHPFVITL